MNLAFQIIMLKEVIIKYSNAEWILSERCLKKQDLILLSAFYIAVSTDVKGEISKDWCGILIVTNATASSELSFPLATFAIQILGTKSDFS